MCVCNWLVLSWLSCNAHDVQREERLDGLAQGLEGVRLLGTQLQEQRSFRWGWPCGGGNGIGISKVLFRECCLISLYRKNKLWMYR